MENNQIVPPHLNAEVYRSNRIGKSNLSYIDYIKMHSDGSVLIGCSELTGRYWDGGASICKDIAELKNTEISCSSFSINLKSGTADGCFVDNSEKVLLCEDTGSVSLWNTNSENAWQLWNEEKSLPGHDGGVLAVDCLKPGQEYVTVGADGNAKVWDLNEMMCLRNYEAHTMPTQALSVQPREQSSVFATGSYDQYISLWDKNICKPALDLVNNDCGITSLQWVDEYKLIYGDVAGVLKMLDLRNPETSVKVAEFPAAVFRTAVKPGGDKVAVCCDNKIVSVCELTEDGKCNVIYHDRHQHSYYVRGLAWDPNQENTLHTVGWNNEIKSHTIS